MNESEGEERERLIIGGDMNAHNGKKKKKTFCLHNTPDNNG